MTNEELILEKLNLLESQIGPISESVNSFNELKKDMTPLAFNAFQLLVKELEDVESSFQLQDLLVMFKQLFRSVRNITYSLQQLENIIDFVNTLEPLLKSTVPQIIHYLDDLEQQGVFRILNATLGIRAKIAKEYSPEDIEQIGDGLVALLGLAKKISDPATLTLLEKAAELPAKLDLTGSKEIGPFGLLWAGTNKEVKEGLGVLIELTKGLGTLKGANTIAEATSDPVS